MSDCMTFPDTVEEFMEQYKVVDTDCVYSNGIEFVPIFRMKQWFEHLQDVEPEIIRCKDCKHWREGITYSYCDKLYGMGVLDIYDYMTSEDDFCSRAERRTDGQTD